MEDKNNYPSLPSNYVTLAQLQERWLKQKQKEEEIKAKQEEQLLQRQQRPNPHQQNFRQYKRREHKPQQQTWRAIQTHPTGFGSANGNRHPKKLGPGNGNSSGSNRVAVEDSCEKREIVGHKADGGDENAGHDGEGNEPKKPKKKKKKSVNQKPRAGKKEKKLAEDAAQSTMEVTKEVENSDVQNQKVEDKMEIKIELNDKSNNLMVVVEEKLGAVSLNSKSDKQNGSFRKPYSRFYGSQRNYGGRFRSQVVQRPRAEALVLGFQHYFLSLGMTVLIPTILVPQMGGGNAEKARVIQSLLFVSGLSTFLQSFFGTRLPTVVVGSYTYLIPTISIIQATRYSSYTDPYETIRGIQGSLIISACFQMAMGFLGFWRIAVRFLSPLSVVPYVTFTGLSLYLLGFPMYLNRYIATERPICDRFAVLFTAASVWLYAQLLTSSTVYNHRPESTQTSCRTDHAGLISSSPWIYIPYPFQWGSPTFNAGEAFAMMAASLVALFESTGTFYAAARYGSATPVPPSVIGRGAGWMVGFIIFCYFLFIVEHKAHYEKGVGVLLNGMFGSVTGSTASVENAGLLALTRVGSRRVIQISAGFMIFFSVFGKLGAFFASVPLPIMAALYCVFFGYVSSAGLGFLQFCNLNSFRTKFVLGFSFFLGISIPQYFREYYHVKHERAGSRWVNDMVTVILMSHSTVAALVAFVLDFTLSRENDATRKDSGLQWWEKFSLYNADVRNNEFYALPCRLDEFFPAV
ncbi:putative nucleobase-ascorbate transporter 10 [Senna tora]|uniref:Putative nucleobase-ascorbate transporter 10 n=1 Tax=Senna tora TaxID=362788 RepID=A0A834TXT0_9FABA|nr:putative nucleobase-ascorbate transporter 10 [Senna tora]